ncbi:hypothetical protein [Microbacterium sp.]|uniref:hypothetical protein n=1 Tax=Microbacterium sp. TaxID=51671 RepID=UPI003F9A00F2
MWIGLIVGLSFMETPLKFLAPGITTALGLGVGRLVFIALSVAGWIILLVLTLIGQARPRESRRGWLLIGAMWLVMIVESFVIRPALAARSDVIIAGGDPGESWLHYGYIAAELLLLVVLIWYVAHATRHIRADAPAA